MKVAITGATGHLGNLIVRELHVRGHLIKALVRGKDRIALESIPVEIIEGDLFNIKALTQLMEGCDALIHTAGMISISGGKDGLVHKTNVEGKKWVMDAAHSAGIRRVIHFSSIHAFEQKPSTQCLHENCTLVSDHAFAYDRSKRESQQLALSYASPQMDVLVLCPTSVIAPFDFKPSKLGKAMMQMCSGKLPFVFNGGFDFCDGRDIAAATVNALQSGNSGEVYLLSGEWVDLKSFYMMVTADAGRRQRPLVIPHAMAYAGIPFVKLLGWLTRNEPFYTKEAIVAVTDGNKMISSDKAKAQLDYHSRPLVETIHDTLSWFRKNGYLG